MSRNSAAGPTLVGIDPDVNTYTSLLTPAEAATVTTLSVRTLANWRSAPGIYAGPPYVRVGNGRGRIRYPLDGLNQWIADQARRDTGDRSKVA